jgi:hypothetical protein
MAAAFGGETRLLAVFGRFPGSLGRWEQHNYKLNETAAREQAG